MRSFLLYIRDYFKSTSLPAFIITVLFVASLIAANYTIGIERRIHGFGTWYLSLGGFYLFFVLVLALVWGLQYEWSWKERKPSTRLFQPHLLLILAIAPLYFSLKMIHWNIAALLPSVPAPWPHYWDMVLQLLLKLLLLITFLVFARRQGWLGGDGFARSLGITTKGINIAPYFTLLALMIPVVGMATTLPDFQAFYPKMKSLDFIDAHAIPSWPWKLLYEISYGLDFLSIELFFRGLLVVALLKFGGEVVILPMAAFYCTIHFGKPMGECISSFIGGLFLGIFAARTRSIVGGLIVHLGLAWMMELGGWVAAKHFVFQW